MEKQTANNEQELLNLKHVCKLCNKSYPSGKSLGGHMRSHVIANTHYNKSKHTLKFTQHRNNDVDDHDHDHLDLSADADDGYRGHYGLRDNPKKTWRIVDSTFTTKKDHRDGSDHERICKQCGKVFQSLKALCGHMSCHSDNNKDKYFKRNVDDNDDDDDDDDDISWSSERGLRNDRENSYYKKRFTRSSYNASFGGGGGGGGGGGSCSNNSEIDQLEHDQEVAMCLMMLSRDHHRNNDDGNNGNYLNVYRHGGNNNNNHKMSSLHLIGTESSDNNSVILEGGSSSNFVKRKVVECNKKKMNGGEEMDNSDSGYFENGAKELESDGSVDGVARSWYGKKPKLDLESGLIELNDKNESKFECLRCNKRFRSHQVLVTHYMNHSRSSSISPEKPQFGTTSTTTNTSGKGIMVATDAKKGSGTKKVKGHKCPYCPKVFKSGQALGGHKRTHMMGSGGGAAAALVVNRMVARDPTPEPEQKQPLIDLNLPAPVDEEACGNSQYLAW